MLIHDPAVFEILIRDPALWNFDPQISNFDIWSRILEILIQESRNFDPTVFEILIRDPSDFEILI